MCCVERLFWLFYLLSASQHGVELLKELVGGIGCAVNDGLVLGLGQDHVFFLQELVQVLPVVKLHVKFEAVVKLVHLELLGVVAAEDLGVNPSIGQVTFRVRNLVRQVQ